MAKVLVVEDDAVVAESLHEFLESEGHLVEVVYDGVGGLDFLQYSGYDLAIIDWQLPGLDGTEICFRYRNAGGKVPILMLTGRSSSAEKSLGLDSGADDYLAKPFDTKELAARVRALLRRSSGFFNVASSFGRVTLEQASSMVSIDGRKVKLLPSEYALIEFLLRHPHTYFSAEQLLRHVWDSSAEVSLEALRTCISRVRHKIEQPGEPSIIETSKGWGYKISEKIL